MRKQGSLHMKIGYNKETKCQNVTVSDFSCHQVVTAADQVELADSACNAIHCIALQAALQ